RSSVPSGRRSSSITEPCAFHGSTTGLLPRSWRIRRSSDRGPTTSADCRSLVALGMTEPCWRPILCERRVQFLEVPPVTRLALWKEPIDLTRRDGPVLEPPLREDRHVGAEHRPNPAPDDVPLERIEVLGRALREHGEGNRLSDRDDRRTRVRTERRESVFSRARIAADATTAVSARIGERMLDGFDSPTLLIEHAIVDDASNRQLPILLDGIVLEILVSAIAVD